MAEVPHEARHPPRPLQPGFSREPFERSAPAQERARADLDVGRPHDVACHVYRLVLADPAYLPRLQLEPELVGHVSL